MKSEHQSKSLRTASLARSLKVCGVLVVLALSQGLSPAVAEILSGESAWDILVREQPEIVASTSSLERKVLQALTPEQAERFTNGEDPSTIVLDSGETLAKFIKSIDAAAIRICVNKHSGLIKFPVTGRCRYNWITIDLPILSEEGDIEVAAGNIIVAKGDLLVEKGDVAAAGEISGLGIVPIGTILPWHRDLPGTPPLPNGWEECNGQTIDLPGSPYDGLALPNLNGERRFLRGGLTSGIQEGASLKAHQHGSGEYEVVSSSVPLEDFYYPGSPGAGLPLVVGGSHQWTWGLLASSWFKGYQVNGVGLGGGAAAYTHNHGDGIHSHQVQGSSAPAPVHDSEEDNETRPTNMSVVWIMRVE